MAKKTEIFIKVNPSKFIRNFKSVLEKRMNRVAQHMAAVVKDSMNTSNQGGKNPSQAGQVPNVGTSKLRESITGVVVKDGKDIVAVYGVIKGPATKYARRLELGFTGSDSKGRVYDQRPRPFLVPALKKNKRQIRKIILGKA